jgi:hypothetical protein
VKFSVDVPDKDARVFHRFLNNDGGVRDGAVRTLIAQHKPPNIAEWTSIVLVLNALSRAIVLADSPAKGGA